MGFMPRLIRVLLGNMLMGLGITLVIQAGLGVDPWTVLTLGTSNTLKVTPGRASQIQAVIIMAGVYLRFQRRPGIGTLLNMFMVGIFIDTFQSLWPVPQAFITQLFMLLGGIVVIGFGVAMYVSGELGEGPIEQLMMALTEHKGWHIAKVRIVMDSLATFFGLLLGGSVGIGTLISVFGIGPVVEKSLLFLSTSGVKDPAVS